MRGFGGRAGTITGSAIGVMVDGEGSWRCEGQGGCGGSLEVREGDGDRGVKARAQGVGGRGRRSVVRVMKYSGVRRDEYRRNIRFTCRRGRRCTGGNRRRKVKGGGSLKDLHLYCCVAPVNNYISICMGEEYMIKKTTGEGEGEGRG